MPPSESDPTFYRALRQFLADEMNGIRGQRYLELFDTAERTESCETLISQVLNAFSVALGEVPDSLLKDALPALDSDLKTRILGECYRRSRDNTISLLHRTSGLHKFLRLFSLIIERNEKEGAELFQAFRDRWGLVVLFQELEMPETHADEKTPEELLQLFKFHLNRFLDAEKLSLLPHRAPLAAALESSARCRFPRNEFPFAEKVITDVEQISDPREPDPATDGLLPFMLNRLRWAKSRIEATGHRIRFSVSRGPLNIASFLMGTTEFLLALKTDPEPMHHLLRIITDFLVRWHALQRETFSTIAGVMVLDDLDGFMGEADFLAFGRPYLRALFAADVPVKFFHNDAPCAASLAHYADLGINLYNPGIQTTLPEMRRLSGGA